MALRIKGIEGVFWQVGRDHQPQRHFYHHGNLYSGDEVQIGNCAIAVKAS